MTDATAASGVSTDGDIPVVEPPPRRTRRPIDGVRILFYGGATAAVVVLAVVAESSFRGLAIDLADLGTQLPQRLIDVVGLAAKLAAWALPVVMIAILIWRRRLATIVELLAAALATALLAGATSALLADYAPDQFQTAFAPLFVGTGSPPIPALPALLVAVATVTHSLNLWRIFQLALFAVIGVIAVGLLEGEASVAGTLVALGTGRVVGLAVRMARGEPSVAPRGRDVAQALTEYGYHVHRVEADPLAVRRRYVVDTDAGPLGVQVLDRESEGAGLLARLVHRLHTRNELLPRNVVTMRAITDRMTLLGLALDWAGGRTPRLRRVIRLGPEATLLIHDHVPGRPVQDLAPDELTDQMLADLWHQLGRMREHQVAHRRIGPRTLLAGEDGQVWLVNPADGEVAAPDLALHTDLAQALVTTALVAGPDRAVATAVRALGPEALAQAVPLLQPTVLTPSTRRALRTRRDLLAALRDRIGSEVDGEPAPPIRVRRFRLLSLVTGVATVAAVYLVGTQLAEVPIGDVVGRADWRWVIVALVAMLLNYIGAAFAVLGFVPEPVPFRWILAAQVTLGFVRLIGPVAVSGSAVNLRLLTRAGVPAPAAAASVAAYQLGAVLVTVPLIAGLGIASGLGVSELRPSTTALLAAVAAVVIGGLLGLIRPVRRLIRRYWNEFARLGMPRLLGVLGRPRKLVEAVGGVLLQTLALVACLYACVRAIGGSPDPAALAVVQMVGHTVGSVVPTPGGLGAVEATLAAGVSAIGIATAVAVPAVLLFRIISFWLPILPAWLLWQQLRRRGLL